MRRAPRPAGAARRRAPGRPRGPTAARAAARPLTERLQKMLARAGLASRREAEVWIRAGRLTVNGRTATLGARVAPHDQVRLDGRLVRAHPAPAGGRASACPPPPRAPPGPPADAG